MIGPKGYREKVYIIKDLILTLGEYGELNQTALLTFCGLNLTKHRNILDELEENQMIIKEEKLIGKRSTTIFKPTPKGLEFCKTILEPYEDLFPRKNPKENQSKNLNFLVLI